VAKGFSKKYVALSGLFGLSFATFVLALFQTPWLAGVSMFGIGFAIAFIVVPAQTLMQQETPHDMLGRVSSSFLAGSRFRNCWDFSFPADWPIRSECGICSLPAQCCLWCYLGLAFCGCETTNPQKRKRFLRRAPNPSNLARSLWAKESAYRKLTSMSGPLGYLPDCQSLGQNHQELTQVLGVHAK
jgi:hypothetical protein